MISKRKIETYAELTMPRFIETRAALRKLIPETPLANYGGVFYQSGRQEQDFHNSFIRIPSLLSDMMSLGLLEFWHSTALISTTEELGIHADGDSRFSYTLVLPVWNTENTYTEFYEPSEPPVPTVLAHEDHDVYYDYYDIKKCKLISRVEILSPTIINVDVPHRVVHNFDNKNVRITAAIRLYGHDDVEEAFARIFNENISKD